MREMGWMMTEMGWQVDEEVNQDKTGEADGMNLEVDSKDEQFCLSVCLSVRPSVRHVPVFYWNDLTYSPIILVLSWSNTVAKFRGGHPLQRR